MKLTLTLLIFLSCLCAFHVNAGEYSEASNFTPINDQRSFFGPVRDQGRTGWCYAFTAADYVEFRIRKSSESPLSWRTWGKQIQIASDEIKDTSKNLLSVVPFVNQEARADASRHLLQLKQEMYDSDRNNSQTMKTQLEENILLYENMKCNSIDEVKEIIDRQINLLKKQLDQINARIEKNEENKKRETVMDGGHVSKVLEDALPYICTNEKFNHYNLDVYKVLDEYYDEIIKPKYGTMKNQGIALTELREFVDFDDEYTRAYFQKLVSAVAPEANVEEFMPKFESIKKYENNLDVLIKNLCVKTKVDMSLDKISKQSSDIYYDPRIEKEIDTALSRGGVVSVSYRAQVFNNPVNPDNRADDFHASLIIGNGLIEGEEYYIIRNSWGAKECKESIIQLPRRKKVFSCDDEGNYIIKKSYFLKYVYGVEKRDDSSNL